MPRRARSGLAAIAAMALALIAVAPATGSSLLAPELSAGPVVTAAGLVWRGPAGIALWRTSGGSLRLAGPATRGTPEQSAEEAWFSGNWWALSTPHALLGGPIARPLHRLPVPADCGPGWRGVPPGGGIGHFAVSATTLYAALPRGCRGLEPARRTELEAIDMRSGATRRLGGALGEVRALAAAGGRVGVLYVASGGAEQVRVLDARSGRVLWQLPVPVPAYSAYSLQLDSRGDLVGGGCCSGAAIARARAIGAMPRPRPAWWAPPRARKAQELQGALDPVLSEGLIVFGGEGEGGMPAIRLRDLRTGAERTLVLFAGTVAALQPVLGEGTLAWAQTESFEQRSGASCREVVLAPVQLERYSVARLAMKPLLVTGPPAPGPPCPVRAIP